MRRFAGSCALHLLKSGTPVQLAACGTPMRGQGDPGMLQRVGPKVDVLFGDGADNSSTKDYHDVDFDLEGLDKDDEFDAESKEETIVEFTDREKIAKLDRISKQRPPRQSCLSEKEQRTLTRMIFNAHYKSISASRDPEDKAMLYQAALELEWIEEWAASQAKKLEATADDQRKLVKRAVLERVDFHKPLSYIIGYQPFFGCTIECTEPLLCPRSETELWTHWFCATCLIEAKQPLRVLDVCCGTGCIGIAIAKNVSNAHVYAVDILEQAVVASERNAHRNGIPAERYTPLLGDMFEPFLQPGGVVGGNQVVKEEYRHKFDAIVSNPPYILPEQYETLPQSVTHWESKVALVGSEERQDKQYTYFKELCEVSAELLKPRHLRDPAVRNAPNIAIEIGLQGGKIADLMERSNLWDNVDMHLDFAQQPRWITATSKH